MSETKTYETIGSLRAALPDLPGGVEIRDRDGDHVSRYSVPLMEGRYAPYAVTYEVPDTPGVARVHVSVTSEEFEAALAEAHDSTVQAAIDLGRDFPVDQPANPWRKS